MLDSKFNWPIVGHENIVDFLQTSISGKKISHAYLFHGPEHLGKRTLAEYFAASLFCYSAKGIPCKECIPCQQFFKKIHPDVYWLKKEEDKRDIVIDQVRKLQERLALSSLTGSYKVAIINQAEALNLEAANALLKTIEEPKGNVVIIMLSKRPSLLPQTVRSRCRQIRFLPVSREKISQFLKNEFFLKENQASGLASLSQGWPGQAIRFAEDRQFLASWQQEVKEFINLTRISIAARFDALPGLLPGKQNTSQVRREDALGLIMLWQTALRDITLIKFNQPELIVNSFAKEELTKLADSYSSQQLADILENTEQAKIYISQNVNQKLVLENLILKL